ncbi:MAG: hypothetical protein MH321_08890 [Leptospiraceae bacterium]|nr:hypothetical protein [Leptospiraceae bacterium]
MYKILFPDPENPKEQIIYLAEIAERARREGLLSIEDLLKSNNSRFFNEITGRVLQLVIDGTDSNIVRFIISNYEISTLENFKYHWQVFRPYFITKRTGDIDDIKKFIKILLLNGHPENNFISDQIKLIESNNFIKSNFIISIEKISHLLDSLYYEALSDMFQSYIALFQRCFRIILTGVTSIQSGDNPGIIIEQLKSLGGVNEKIDFPSPNIIGKKMSQDEIDDLLGKG